MTTISDPPQHPRKGTRSPEKAFSWSVIVLALALLAPALVELFPFWMNNPLYGHGLWVFPLALVLFHRAWRGRAQPIPRAFLLLVGAYFSVHLLGMAFLRLVQVANPDWRLLSWLSSVSTLVALALLLLWIGGPAVLRRCWFALAFFLTGLPWPTWLEIQFTNTVAPFSAQMATEFL